MSVPCIVSPVRMSARVSLAHLKYVLRSCVGRSETHEGSELFRWSLTNHSVHRSFCISVDKSSKQGLEENCTIIYHQKYFQVPCLLLMMILNYLETLMMRRRWHWFSAKNKYFLELEWSRRDQNRFYCEKPRRRVKCWVGIKIDIVIAGKMDGIIILV